MIFTPPVISSYCNIMYEFGVHGTGKDRHNAQHGGVYSGDNHPIPYPRYPKPAVIIDDIPYYIAPPPCYDYMNRAWIKGHYWQEQWQDDTEIRSVCVRCGMRRQEITGELTLYAISPRHDMTQYGWHGGRDV